MSDLVKVSLRIDPDLWRAARAYSRAHRDMTLGRLLQAAMESRLEEWVGEERRSLDGRIKPAGHPFPPREGRVKTGRPIDAEGSTGDPVGVLIEEEVRERWWDAVYWHGSYVSYETEQALREHLAQLKS